MDNDNTETTFIPAYETSTLVTLISGSRENFAENSTCAGKPLCTINSLFSLSKHFFDNVGQHGGGIFCKYFSTCFCRYAFIAFLFLVSAGFSRN